jgi:hypothetical protein
MRARYDDRTPASCRGTMMQHQIANSRTVAHEYQGLADE